MVNMYTRLRRKTAVKLLIRKVIKANCTQKKIPIHKSHFIENDGKCVRLRVNNILMPSIVLRMN